MKTKHTLFLAMAGTFDPTYITHNLIVMEYDFKRQRRSFRKVKKELKLSNVVMLVNDRLLCLKIPYIVVMPAKGIDNTLWYMRQDWVEAEQRYAYFNKRKALRRKVSRQNTIFLKNEELLHDYLEGTE